MWVSTKKNYGNSLMFFQFIKRNNFYIFNFTNMKQFYSKEIHESSFSSIYSTKNQIIEVESANVVKFLENIKDTNNINFNFYPNYSKMRVDMLITLTKGFPAFELGLELELKDTNYFYSNVTSPLIKIIQMLKRNQEDLLNLLKKKDSIIAEFILEGGNITHENVKTEILENDTFLMNSLQNHKDLFKESTNLYDLYSSSLIEEFSSDRCHEKHEALNSVTNKEENTEINSKKKYIDCKASSSTTMEGTPINIKKKKIISLLNNL